MVSPKLTPIKIAVLAVMIIYLLPTVVALFLLESVPLPYLFTQVSEVDKIPLTLTILIFGGILIFTLIVERHFFTTPSIIVDSKIRFILIFIYLLISIFSVHVMVAKMDYVDRLVDNPVLALLSFGALLPEEKLLAYFFLGSFAPVAHSLVLDDDPKLLRFFILFLTVGFIAFYLTLGRREIAIMLMLMVASKYKSNNYRRVLVSIMFAIVIAVGFFLLRSDYSNQDTDDFWGGFTETSSTAIEELSPLTISAYVISIGGLNDGATFLNGLLPTRFLEEGVSKSISSGFFGRVSSNSGTGPVVGIVATSVEYGVFVPLIILYIMIILGSWCWNMYKKDRGDHWRIIAVFLGFKIFNILRNGEFAIVLLDIIMYFALFSPLILLSFKKSSLANSS